jgi:hypothetical protein
MRFRTTELLFGMLLAVAIFAMGMLFVSSGYAPQTTQNISAPKAANQGEQSKPPDSDLTGSTWLTKDASGFFTFVLVVVGSLQALFFWYQLGLIRQSLAPAKEAADAAKINAQAVMDAEGAHLYPVVKKTNVSNHQVFLDPLCMGKVVQIPTQFPLRPSSIALKITGRRRLFFNPSCTISIFSKPPPKAD